MSASGGIEHFEDDELSAGGDTCNAAVGVGAVTRDDAGDVCAVAEAVFRDNAGAGDAPGEVNDIAGKVYIVDHALTAAAIGEIVVPADDAGVDYGDADPGAINAKILPGGHGADRFRGPVHRRNDHAIERHVFYQRAGCDFGKRGVRDDCRQAAATASRFPTLPPTLRMKWSMAFLRRGTSGVNDDPGAAAGFRRADL